MLNIVIHKTVNGSYKCNEIIALNIKIQQRPKGLFKFFKKWNKAINQKYLDDLNSIFNYYTHT